MLVFITLLLGILFLYYFQLGGNMSDPGKKLDLWLLVGPELERGGGKSFEKNRWGRLLGTREYGCGSILYYMFNVNNRNTRTRC